MWFISQITRSSLFLVISGGTGFICGPAMSKNDQYFQQAQIAKDRTPGTVYAKIGQISMPRAYGTGFLITPCHVMTSAHIFIKDDGTRRKGEIRFRYGQPKATQRARRSRVIDAVAAQFELERRSALYARAFLEAAEPVLDQLIKNAHMRRLVALSDKSLRVQLSRLVALHHRRKNSPMADSEYQVLNPRHRAYVGLWSLYYDPIMGDVSKIDGKLKQRLVRAYKTWKPYFLKIGRAAGRYRTEHNRLSAANKGAFEASTRAKVLEIGRFFGRDERHQLYMKAVELGVEGQLAESRRYLTIWGRSRGDWAVLRLEKCIGHSLGYIRLKSPNDQIDPDSVFVAGYPGDRNSNKIWITAFCKLLPKSHNQTEGQFLTACSGQRGMSGGPLLARIKGREELVALGIYGASFTERFRDATLPAQFLLRENVDEPFRTFYPGIPWAENKKAHDTATNYYVRPYVDKRCSSYASYKRVSQAEERRTLRLLKAESKFKVSVPTLDAFWEECRSVGSGPSTDFALYCLARKHTDLLFDLRAANKDLKWVARRMYRQTTKWGDLEEWCTP